jgi:tetratricopeptide (TPR) repeat protein
MAKHDKRSHGAHRPSASPHERGSQGTPTPALSGPQQAALDALLARVPVLADALRAAYPAGRVALIQALAPVEQAEQPVRQSFAMRLGDVRGPAAASAAEVANALGELAEARELAREARRARIRLRSVGALPTLDLALVGSSTAISPTAPPVPAGPQLVEAFVSRTRDEGEVVVLLAWQEGTDTEVVRVWTIDIDFFEHGIKAMNVRSPMTLQRFHSEMLANLRQQVHAETTPLTWAQARGLVLEGMDVTTWRGVELPADFRRHRTAVQTRLLDIAADNETAQAAASAEDERLTREGHLPYVAAGLQPDESVATWLGAWTFGDFGLAYDLLAADHPTRRQQTRAEYIAQRRQWTSEARPASLRLTLAREQAQRASALWVPGATGTVSSRREVEAFWSITLDESPLGGALDELPLATITSAQTGRHWYWTAYTMQHDHERDLWRLARDRDEGRASQTLTIDELQQRLKEAHDTVEKLAATPAPQGDSEAAETMLRELTGVLTAALHYHDAVILKLPLDESASEAAVSDAQGIGAYERAAALLERREQRFPGRARTSFDLGVQYYLMAIQVARVGDATAEPVWLDRAARAFQRSIELEPSAERLQALGEVLGHQGHYAQAVARLREAVALDPTHASAHSDLANALMSAVSDENLDETPPISSLPDSERNQRVADAGHAALAELRETVRLDPSIQRVHARMGAIYDILGMPEDALLAFQEAVRHDPGDAEAHFTLGALHLHRKDAMGAVPELEEAVHLAPASANARITLATAYLDLRRWREAEYELREVERLRPNLPQVAELRARLAREREAD